MAKIVFLVGEHKNENVGYLRARHAKPLLEAMGHEVTIAPAGAEPSIHSFARGLFRAKRKRQAFTLIKKFLKQRPEDIGSHGNVPLVSTDLVSFKGKDFPDAHVFSLHNSQADKFNGKEPYDTLLRKFRLIGPGKIDQQISEMDHHIRLSYDLDDAGNVIAYRTAGKPPRVRGVIETLANYEPYPAASDGKSFSWAGAAAKANKWIDEWAKDPNNKRKAEHLREIIQNYCTQHTSREQGIWADKKHATSLANAIHALVTNPNTTKRLFKADGQSS